MGDKNTEILDKVIGIITDFCSEIANEPLLFFSEADLQGLLFQKLNMEIGKQIKTKYRKGPNSKNVYKTLNIHREYGLNTKIKERMDIAIFRDEDISMINNPNLQQNNGDYLKPFIGIELGTEKTAEFKKHISNDNTKLENVEYGFIIHFERDKTISPKMTGRGQRTIGKLTKQIIHPLDKLNFNTNVIPLIFILTLPKRDRKVLGKCKIFKNNKFVALNLSTIKEDVIKIINEQIKKSRNIK